MASEGVMLFSDFLPPSIIELVGARGSLQVQFRALILPYFLESL